MKTRYVILGLGSLFAVLTFLSFYFYWQDNQVLLEQAAQKGLTEGQAFGKNHSQAQCLDQVIKLTESCRETDCTIELKQFSAACFANASPSPEMCNKAPEAGDFFGITSWSVSLCRKRKIKNGNCPNIVRGIADYCSQHHIKQ